MTEVLLSLAGALPMILFLFLTFGGGNLISQWLENRKQLKIEEQKTRRIEAMASMSREGQAKLLEQVPDWIDKGDPEELAAWKAARAELNRAG